MLTTKYYKVDKIRSIPKTFATPSRLISLLGIIMSAQGANLCVNPAGSGGCHTTISAAVLAASPGDTVNVGPGTYDEQVNITKSLSLVGAGPATTHIRASGFSNAVYINNGGAIVSNVVVTGFSLGYANFEGILVNGASSVTIWGNIVSENDKSLQPSSDSVCPGLTTVYPFEGNEQDDCGEGIHLTNVSSSVVAYNLVTGNAGGILVSDDTGPTHDNSIRNNTVTNNVYDCGITLPSHTPFGVYHNTVSGNLVTGNGTSPLVGGGAGVGLFSPGGPTSNYGNSVVNNELTGNGMAGVAMHTHAPGTEVLQDIVIAGNHIAHNGADPDLGLTAAQGDGISLLVVGGNVSGIVISENTFDDEAEDIVISSNVPVQITATLNNFSYNSIAVDNVASPGPPPLISGGASVNAAENWWGCSGGPGASGCATFASATGSSVLTSPWLTSPVSEPAFTAPWVP